MGNDVYFETGGLDELDTQIKLFELGVESFSPYASTGKVDMIIRSDKNEHVRYADIKVCTGRREKQKIEWKIKISFFMNNESFIVLSFRLPTEDESLEKHHFIISSAEFLEVMKKAKVIARDNYWVLALPYSELQLVNSKKQTGIKSKMVKALRPFLNKWENIADWAHNSE
ncbi:MAG: hypothetical protein ACW97Z_13300 [Candidatus Hodarchaeales archaeon]|jgi:hypothetical protein